MGVGASKLLESAATTPGTKGVLSNDRLHGGSVEASPSSPAVICSFARYANSSSSPLPSAAAEATGAPTALAAFFAAFAAALPAALASASEAPAASAAFFAAFFAALITASSAAAAAGGSGSFSAVRAAFVALVASSVRFSFLFFGSIGAAPMNDGGTAGPTTVREGTLYPARRARGGY